MGCIEVSLKISDIKAFSEDILMLVIEDSNYGQRVLLKELCISTEP